MGIIMKMFSTILLMIFILSVSLKSQEFKSPESAAYDPVQNRYYISNFGDGNIIEVDSNGVRYYFKKGLAKSLGMIIQDNILYVISNFKKVTGFSLADTSRTFEIIIEQAKFLNDITGDGKDNLYVTDSNAKKIYKINVSIKSYSLFWDSDLNGPNGILYNKQTHSIIVCNFTNNALIQSISLKDSAISVLDSTKFSNLDGLAIDNQGNIYVSFWDSGSFKTGFTKTGSVYKYDNAFINSPQLIASNLYGPADIFYNMYKSELVIPLFLENVVKFISITADVTQNK